VNVLGYPAFAFPKMVVYRAAPPAVRQKIRDMVVRSFGEVDAGDDRLATPSRHPRATAGAA
jgi:hypothetical protein